MLEQRPDLTILAAYDANRAIGRRGTIPWHIPSDLRQFRRRTEDGIVIMGRKTWESLPDDFRPLPNRFNVVISRRRDYQAKGAFVCGSFREAYDLATCEIAPVFVVGGAEIYAQALPHATKLILTEVQATFSRCDTYFPHYDPREWAEISAALIREPGDAYRYRVRELVRADQLVAMDCIHAHLSRAGTTHLATLQ